MNIAPSVNVEGLRQIASEPVAKEDELAPFIAAGLIMLEKSASGIQSYDLTDAGRAMLKGTGS